MTQTTPAPRGWGGTSIVSGGDGVTFAGGADGCTRAPSVETAEPIAQPTATSLG